MCDDDEVAGWRMRSPLHTLGKSRPPTPCERFHLGRRPLLPPLLPLLTTQKSLFQESPSYNVRTDRRHRNTVSWLLTRSWAQTDSLKNTHHYTRYPCFKRAICSPFVLWKKSSRNTNTYDMPHRISPGHCQMDTP